jgi:hypothetical protein
LAGQTRAEARVFVFCRDDISALDIISELRYNKIWIILNGVSP